MELHPGPTPRRFSQAAPEIQRLRPQLFLLVAQAPCKKKISIFFSKWKLGFFPMSCIWSKSHLQFYLAQMQTMDVDQFPTWRVHMRAFESRSKPKPASVPQLGFGPSKTYLSSGSLKLFSPNETKPKTWYKGSLVKPGICTHSWLRLLQTNLSGL